MARRAGIMTRYVEYRYPFVFLPVSFWVSPKKEGGRKTIAVTAHAASRQHAPEGRRRVLTSTIQTRSTVNPGTPHRRAALLANTSVPIVSRKEVADSRLSPGVSAGRSETAPGITAVTRSAGDTLPQGFPPHRLSPVVRLYRGVSGSRSRMRQAVVTSVITHLASLDCYTQEQLLGRLPPRTFHRNTVKGRLSLRQSDGYGKARKAARCTETLNVRETLPVKECSD